MIKMPKNFMINKNRIFFDVPFLSKQLKGKNAMRNTYLIFLLVTGIYTIQNNCYLKIQRLLNSFIMLVKTTYQILLVKEIDIMTSHVEGSEKKILQQMLIKYLKMKCYIKIDVITSIKQNIPVYITTCFDKKKIKKMRKKEFKQIQDKQ